MESWVVLPLISRIDLQGSRNFLAKLGMWTKQGEPIVNAALVGCRLGPGRWLYLLGCLVKPFPLYDEAGSRIYLVGENLASNRSASRRLPHMIMFVEHIGKVSGIRKVLTAGLILDLKSKGRWLGRTLRSRESSGTYST